MIFIIALNCVFIKQSGLPILLHRIKIKNLWKIKNLNGSSYRQTYEENLPSSLTTFSSTP